MHRINTKKGLTWPHSNMLGEFRCPLHCRWHIKYWSFTDVFYPDINLNKCWQCWQDTPFKYGYDSPHLEIAICVSPLNQLLLGGLWRGRSSEEGYGKSSSHRGRWGCPRVHLMVAKCRPCWLFDPHTLGFLFIEAFLQRVTPKSFPNDRLDNYAHAEVIWTHLCILVLFHQKQKTSESSANLEIQPWWHCDISPAKPHRPPWNWTCSFPPSYPKLDRRKKAGWRDVKGEPGIFLFDETTWGWWERVQIIRFV